MSNEDFLGDFQNADEEEREVESENEAFDGLENNLDNIVDQFPEEV